MSQRQLIDIPRLLPKATILGHAFSEGFRVQVVGISFLHAKVKSKGFEKEPLRLG